MPPWLFLLSSYVFQYTSLYTWVGENIVTKQDKKKKKKKKTYKKKQKKKLSLSENLVKNVCIFSGKNESYTCVFFLPVRKVF